MSTQKHSKTKIILLGVVVAVLSLAASVHDMEMTPMQQLISLDGKSEKAASEALKVESAVKLEKMALAKRLAKQTDKKSGKRGNSIGSSAVNTPQEVREKDYIVVF
jgi:hypothetical protein